MMPPRIGFARPAAALCAVLVLSATLVRGADRTPRPAEYASFKPGLVHVGISTISGDLVAIQWLGSGLLIDKECTVATARHILDGVDMDRVILRLLHPDSAQGARTYSAEVLWEDPDTDRIFLGFGGAALGRKLCRADTFRPFALVEAFDGPSLTGEAVWVAGFPQLEGEQPRDVPIVRRGVIASAEMTWDEQPMLLLDLTGVPGLSGGPVILERDGSVIGLIFGPGRTSRQYDLEWATPLTAEDYERARRIWKSSR
jgi:S1-C subfamily serine protease